MLGYTKDGTEPVGQEQFEAMMVKKNMRVEVKNICRALCEQNHIMHTGNAQTAKQLLRIALISTCAIRSDGAVQTSVVSTEALGHGVFNQSDVWCRFFSVDSVHCVDMRSISFVKKDYVFRDAIQYSCVQL